MNIKIIIIILLIIYYKFRKNKNTEFFDINNNRVYRNSIVRVHAQNIKFNWLEPYKNSGSNESIGTGFFIDNKGHILTCAHVVDDSIKTYVSIPQVGKMLFDTEIIRIAPYHDLAILKIKNYKNKNYLEFSDSDKVKSGDNVIALGYPLGQDRLKRTSGVISGIQDGDLQTDTPINPGNSGGPLLNENGEVIGINFAGYSAMVAENIGYAIPSFKFNLLKKDLLDTKAKNIIIKKPILGSSFNNTSKEMFEFNKNQLCHSGYYINAVYKNSPFDKAGIKKGDILCKFGGYSLDNYGETKVDWSMDKVSIVDLFNRHKVGDKIDVEYLRNSELVETEVETKSIDYYNIRNYYPGYEKIEYLIFGGLILMNLSMNHLKEIETLGEKIDKYKKLENQIEPKILVSYVFPGSYMNSLKVIAQGDIIKEINSIKVNTIKECLDALKSPLERKGKDKYRLTFLTEDNLFVMLNLKKVLDEEKFLSEQHGYKVNKKLFNYLNNL